MRSYDVRPVGDHTAIALVTIFDMSVCVDYRTACHLMSVVCTRDLIVPGMVAVDVWLEMTCSWCSLTSLLSCWARALPPSSFEFGASSASNRTLTRVGACRSFDSTRSQLPPAASDRAGFLCMMMYPPAPASLPRQTLCLTNAGAIGVVSASYQHPSSQLSHLSNPPTILFYSRRISQI